MEQVISTDEHFCTIYVAHLLRDQDFFTYTFQDLKPEIFPSQNAQRIVRLILQFVQETGTTPDKLIYRELEKHKQVLGDGTYSALKTYVDELYEIPLRDKKYLLDEHDNFCKSQLLKGMIPKLVECGRKGDHGGIEDLFKQYLEYKPKGVLDPGVDFSDAMDERIERRLHREEKNALIFGIPPLDDKGICFYPGALIVFQSQKTSMGKTTTVCQVARNLVMQGKNGIIYTLEETAQEIEDKMDQTISGVTPEELTDRTKLQLKMKTWLNGHLRIKEWDAYHTKPSDLAQHVRMLQNYYGFRPDFVIINAADSLVPERYKDSLYASGRDVYAFLKAWAAREQMVVIVDMQSNRGAAEKVVAGTEDASGSIAKAQIATMVITINRTPEEAKEGLTTFNVAKNRHGLAGFQVTFKSDLARAQIWTK